MDWLMGKARGVSRGLMNSNSPVSAPVSPECPAASVGGTHLASCSVHTTTPENGSRPTTLSTEVSVSNGDVGRPSSSRFPSPTLSPSPDNSPSVKRRNSCKSNKNSPESVEPMFMQQKYITQQLPVSNTTSEYIVEFPQLVEPFPSMEQNEWLAAHTIALFDNISTIFDAIQELCTCSQLLPCQSGSASFPSVWNFHAESMLTSNFDEEKCKKHKNASSMSPLATPAKARQELDTALSSCNDLIQSSKIFPVRQGDPFPLDLQAYVTLICKNLLICIIHIYLAHFHHLEQLELIPHMNTVAKHFFSFTMRFSLIDEKHFDPLMGFHKILLDCPIV